MNLDYQENNDYLEENDYSEWIKINDNVSNLINQLYPHHGTLYFTFYDNNRKMMIGYTNSDSVEKQIEIKINNEIIYNNFTPSDILIYSFTNENMIKLMELYPLQPTVSKFNKYIKCYFNQFSLDSKKGNHVNHFCSYDNFQIDFMEIHNFFQELGFDVNSENYWHLKENQDFTIESDKDF